MLKSFKQLADEPGSPLKPRPANGRDVVAWLEQARVKLQDAQQPSVSAGTRMDAAWDAVLMASLAVACAEGWTATSDRGHHEVIWEGAAHALGLGSGRHDELDALRGWRNRKYRAQQGSTEAEVAEAVALVAPFLDRDVTEWFASRHAKLLKQGLAR